MLKLSALSRQTTPRNDFHPESTENRVYSNNKSGLVYFSGLHHADAQSMFVFDLDGTFAHGDDDALKSVLKLIQLQHTAEIQSGKSNILLYATGRTRKEFMALQQRLADKGITLPTPKYLISNNGQFIDENIDGVLIPDPHWEKQLLAKTNFNRAIIYNEMKQLAHHPDYLLDQNQFQHAVDFQQVQQADPDFWKSKISHYEWNASHLMMEYFVAPDVSIPELQHRISEQLRTHGIQTKFILNRYSKPIMDRCTPAIRMQTQPLREDAQGTVTALFLCPADKADGVEYLREKKQIPYREIVMAGNDTNDISLAHLAQKGAYFICVKNAHPLLLEVVSTLKSVLSNIIATTREGAAGIAEGLQEIFESLPLAEKTAKANAANRAEEQAN